MPSPPAIVRAIVPADYPAWLDMWKAYCAFYEAEISAHVIASTWRSLIAGDANMHGLVAVSPATGTTLGFAHYIIHPFTWSDRPACYLEDLFVRIDGRGSGVGYALIERLTALAAEHGWARIYWMTRQTNVAAQRLYDRFCERDDFVRYVLEVPAPNEERTAARSDPAGSG